MKVPELWLEYALESVAAADLLYEDGFAVDSVSRAYYAMLYAAEALLTREGVFLRQSTQVVAALGREMVLSGKLPEVHHRNLVELYTLRKRVDYDVFYQVTEEETRRQLRRAREFVQWVEKSFPGQRRGWLHRFRRGPSQT
ncbi:HEPN domain-containing protein [bacterium]|nr:HEPN domain-containing protein [bacterium]